MLLVADFLMILWLLGLSNDLLYLPLKDTTYTFRARSGRVSVIIILRCALLEMRRLMIHHKCA